MAMSSIDPIVVFGPCGVPLPGPRNADSRMIKCLDGLPFKDQAEMAVSVC